MSSGQYKYYAKPDGIRTAVPKGYSFGALLLGPIWAAFNGYLIYYLLLLIPYFLFLFLGLNVLFLFVFIGEIYIFVVMIFIIPSMAFKWKEQSLVRKGYDFKGTVRAGSAIRAIEEYESKKKCN